MKQDVLAPRGRASLNPAFVSELNADLGGRAHARIIKAACVCTLLVILAAGLWPFHVPKNNVSWLVHDDGLYFGRHGSAISVGSFPVPDDKVSGSVELWLEPGLSNGTHTILSFDGSNHSGAPFAIRQLDDSLLVEQDNEDVNGTSWTAWTVVNGVFARGKPVFASIVLGPRHTSVYIDGAFKKDGHIGDSVNNLTGRLLVANSPTSNDSWSGAIKGLAIYDRQLTRSEILEHYESWTKNNRPPLTQTQSPIALYLFGEHSGVVAHNEFDHTTDLTIPKRYFVLHPAFLESAVHSYHPSWSYWQDVVVNVVGFIPLGFFATAYLYSVRRKRGAVAIAIGLGFLTSLAIEILQAFLPTRDSGMNDLITNTFGTVVGAMLYMRVARTRWSPARSILGRIGCL